MSSTQPQNISDLYEQGIRSLQENKTDRAIAQLMQVVASEPDSALGHFHLANAYAQQHRWEEAESHFDKVIELKPQWPQGFYRAGQVALMRGYSDDAIGFFSEALKQGMDKRQVYTSRGMAFHDCGRYAEAIDDFDAVLTQELDVNALKYRMVCLLGMHRLHEAMADIDLLLEIQDEDARPDLLEIRALCKSQLQPNHVGESIPVTPIEA